MSSLVQLYPSAHNYLRPCLHATGGVNQYFSFIFFNHKEIEAQLITTSSQEYRHDSSQKPTLGRNKTNSG